MTKQQFRFSHRGSDGRLYWVSRSATDGESRKTIIHTSVAFFWRGRFTS